MNLSTGQCFNYRKVTPTLPLPCYFSKANVQYFNPTRKTVNLPGLVALMPVIPALEADTRRSRVQGQARICETYLKIQVSQMPQREKVSDAKPDDQSSIPKIHRVERKLGST